MTIGDRMRVAGLLPLLLLTTGCYSYVPTAADTLRPGTDVRARLSPAGVATLAEAVPSAPRVVEGKVVERGDGGLLLEVPATTFERGVRLETLHQRVRIAEKDILEVELKRLDRGRTGLVVAGGVAAAVVTFLQLRGDPGEGEQRPGPGTDVVLPVRALLDLLFR